ncbi:hypothetical protein YC2023_066956 [Brassica napus]
MKKLRWRLSNDDSMCVEKLNYALLLSEMQLGQETKVGEYILKPKTIEREKTFNHLRDDM